MSARQRRRLAATVGDAAGDGESSSDGGGSDAGIAVPSAPRFSLLQLSETESESEVEVAASASSGAGAAAAEGGDAVNSDSGDDAPAAAARPARMRRRRHRPRAVRGGGGSGVGDGAPVSEAAPPLRSASGTGDGDGGGGPYAVDAASAAPAADGGAMPAPFAALLVPNARAMNVDEELRRFLGMRRRGPSLAMLRRRGEAAAGGDGVFVTVRGGDEYWPMPTRARRGITCSRTLAAVAGDVAGAMEFTMDASDEYVAVDAEIAGALSQTTDPAVLQRLYAACPYNLELLLALYEVFRATGQTEAAGQKLRQAAFALQTLLAQAHSFRPWAAPMRFARPHSRLMHTVIRVLFRFMQHCGRIGAPGAACAIASLQLQLCGYQPGPDAPIAAAVCDPHRLLLYWDHFAIRAGAYDALLTLTGATMATPAGGGAARLQAGYYLPESDVPVALLPNMAIARSLALLLGPQRGMPTRPADVVPPAAVHTAVAAAAAPVDEDALLHLYADATPARFDASQQMVWALVLFPSVYQPLAALCAQAADGGAGAPRLPAAAAWSALGARPAFRTLLPGSLSDAHDKLVQVLPSRGAAVWRDARVAAWFFDCAFAAAELLEAEAAAATVAPTSRAATIFAAADVAQAASTSARVVRTQLFARGSVADTRLQRAIDALSHYASVVPSELADAVVPIDAGIADADDGGGGDGGWNARAGGGRAPLPGFRLLDLRTDNLLLLFMRSLLPWYLIPGAALVQDGLAGGFGFEGGGDDEGDVAGDGDGAEGDD